MDNSITCSACSLFTEGKKFYGFLAVYHDKQIAPKTQEKIQEHLTEIVTLIGELSTVSILRKIEKVLYGIEI